MAKDLIPPPSPAGRPPADGASEARADAELEAAARPPDVEAPAGASPYRGRFGFIWGALAGTAIVAIAATVALIGSAGSDGPPLAKNWSEWKPSTSRMVDGARDIADHVGREYKLDSGDQLVSVSSSAIQLSGAPLGVAVRPKGEDLQLLKGDGLLFVLNGLGQDGSIAGKATKQRGRLLLREAVELSLYSFRYLDDVTMVAVMLPPPPPTSAGTSSGTTDPESLRAVFYRPGDLLDKLQVPLTQTLPAKVPTPKKLTRAEGLAIDSLTLRNLFLAKIQPLQSDMDYLVLTAPTKIQ